MKRIWFYKDDQRIWGIYIWKSRLGLELIKCFGRYRIKFYIKFW